MQEKIEMRNDEAIYLLAGYGSNISPGNPLRDAIVMGIKALETQRPKGKWLFRRHNWWCSNCGDSPFKGTGFVPSRNMMVKRWNFCNLCGAEMEVGDETN